MRRYNILPSLIILGSLSIIGCSGKSAPSLNPAYAALREAERTEAPVYAPSEYKIAKDKVDRAKIAISRERFDEARWLGEQAVEDARYAQLRSEAEQAHKSAVQQDTTARDLKAAK